MMYNEFHITQCLEEFRKRFADEVIQEAEQ